MSKPLAGLRVLEVANGIAGPYAGRLFAMLGATVTKVEPPGGDPARGIPVDDTPPPDGPSPLFIHLNEGKDEGAANRLDRLIDQAHIVLVDRVRKQVEGTPLDPATLAARSGRRVLVTVTAWGFEADEPGQPDDELLVQAASGVMAATTDPGEEPLRFPGWQSQYLAGGFAAASALAAFGRQPTGLTHVDVDWLTAVLTGAEGDVAQFLHQASIGVDPPETPHGGGVFPAGVFRCADGYVVPGTVRPIDWKLQCEIYGRADLLEDERFHIRHRWRNRDELRSEIQPWYDAHTKREIFTAALDEGWAAAMVMTAGDAVDDPHLTERGFLGPSTQEPAATIPARPWLATPSSNREGDFAMPDL